jgi:N-acetyl-S-(2-succino)cysteine monooxygenase
MERPRQMHLCLYLVPAGYQTGAWRWPESRAEEIPTLNFLSMIAAHAERAKFDAVFIADNVSLEHMGEHPGKEPPRLPLEPLTTLSALAASTSRVGLIATASTTFTQPYNLARYFASLDHLSNGRAGWNIVTSWKGGENFDGGLPEHEERYRRATEYVQLVQQLWDSWEDEAVVVDRKGGYWARPERIHHIDFDGKYHNVAGPLNIPRSPQGWPLLVQAGGSATGMEFAATYGEMIFSVQHELGAGKEFASHIRSLVAAKGRDPSKVAILPGLVPIIGDTSSEARDLAAELAELGQFEEARDRLKINWKIDIEDLELDDVVPKERLPLPETFQGPRGRYETFYKLAVDERYTVGRLMKFYAASGGHMVLTGTAEEIADTMAQWVAEGACDGFNLQPPFMVEGLTAITDKLVPVLQERGLFRSEYTGTTLREHLGVERPPGRPATPVP